MTEDRMTDTPLSIGAKVYTWFDTGAFGQSILYGEVVKPTGDKSMTVQWESGLRNRLKQGDHRVLIRKDK